VSRGMAWTAMGVGWAGGSYAAAQMATGGGSRRYRRWWAAEARISEIEDEARHPLDGHPTTTTARTVC